MSCGTALEARRNSDERWTFTPSSRNYTFSGMAPLFTVRRGETALLQIDQTQTVNGSLFSVVGDSVVLQLKKGDAALLDGPTPDTDAEALFYDVTLTDQTGFENWIVGGSFTLLGLNDASCGGCNEKVEVTIGGQCIQINIEGGNLGIGASVNLAALNQAVQDAETAAGEAEQSAAEAATAGATAGAAAGSTSGAAAGSSSGATAGGAAGTAAANAVVAGKANIGLDNVSAEDFSGKAYPVPIGGSGVGIVPSDTAARWRHYANAETDFGITIFQPDGVTIKDNQAEIQRAIDRLQSYNGALFFPPASETGQSGIVETSPVTLRSGIVDGKNYDGAGVAFVGISPGDRTSFQNGRFDLGQGMKLKAGSTQPLITSPAKAGHLVIENMLLNGNDVDVRTIDLVNRTDGNYGFGAYLTNVYMVGAGRAALNIGVNRGRGATQNLWIEYAKGGGGEAALIQGAYDWEHVGLQIGVNDGPAIYLGAVSQVRFFGGAAWMSGGVIVSPDCEDVDFFGFHFDQHRTYGLDVSAYTGTATRRGTRRFIGCRWSDNSDTTSGAASDIRLAAGVQDCYFSAPSFMGKGQSAPKNAYCVEAGAGAIFYADAFPFSDGGQKPYLTAFTNDWTTVRFGGWEKASWGVGNSGSSLIARAGTGYGAEFRQDEANLGDVAGQAPLRVNKISGGNYNRLLIQSTSNAFDYPVISVESGFTNADIAIAPKGSGFVRMGTHTTNADAPITGYIGIRDSGGVFRKLAVIS